MTVLSSRRARLGATVVAIAVVIGAVGASSDHDGMATLARIAR